MRRNRGDPLGFVQHIPHAWLERDPDARDMHAPKGLIGQVSEIDAPAATRGRESAVMQRLTE
jgi:hypothetical protein